MKNKKKPLLVTPEWEKVLKTKQAIKNFVDPASPTFGNKDQSAVLASAPPLALSTPSAVKAVKKTLEKAFEEAGITEDTLAKRHKQLLMKNEIKYDVKTGEFKATKFPDTMAVKSALEMAYKVRGDYAPERSLVGVTDITSILDSIQSDERPTVTIHRGPAPEIGIQSDLRGNPEEARGPGLEAE